jgi:hypothetical protein
MYESNKRNWVLLRAHRVWEQQKKVDIIESTLCMRATKETGYYWKHTIRDQLQKLGIIDSMLSMTVTDETGYYSKHYVYDSMHDFRLLH